MFWKRTATAILLIAYIVGMVILGYFFGHIFIDLAVLSFGLVALYEMYISFHSAGYKVFKAPLIAIGLSLYPCYALFDIFKGMGTQGMLVAFLISCAIAITIFTFSHTRELNDLMATMFILVYPFLFLSTAFVLTSSYSAVFIILFAVFLPVSCDSFAYWIGSTVKGKKLCPLISPNKTIAGAIGGLFGGVVASIAFFMFFEVFNVLPNIGYVPFTDSIWKSSLIYIALGIAAAVVSQLGDIAASRIKRKLGIKDYGKIFPGHGGSMDRMDSVMFTLVLLLLCFSLIY